TPSDNVWRGPVTMNTSAAIDVSPGARLTVVGAIDDATNPAAGGSDVIAVGAGELVLAGTNKYRGFTYIGTSATPGSPGLDPQHANEFFHPGSPQAIGNVVVTAASSQALGAATRGTIVQNGSALQLEGNITIAGEALTVSGAGVP